jgi:hypothetical protein
MKVVYIGWCEILNTKNLTKNKTYYSSWECSKWYEITDDAGYPCFHEKYNFVLLSDFREKRINSILD